MASMLTRSRVFPLSSKTSFTFHNKSSDFLSPFGPVGGACSAGNLKEVRNRIKSIKSIEKITKTMKMIASSRLKAAQTRMEKARPFYQGASKILDIFPTDTTKKNLLIPVTADRGLCGGVNSSIAKVTRLLIHDRSKNSETSISLVSIGSKGTGILGRDQSERISFSVDNFGAKFSWSSIPLITERILKDISFDSITVIFNKFITILAYSQDQRDIPSPTQFAAKPELSKYEFEEDQRLFHIPDLFEFELGATLYHAFVESAAVELGARMTAMDSASKNATEMLKSLNISYNRKRQAAITTELTEIISGAAAISG